MRLGNLLLVGGSILAVMAAFACQTQSTQAFSRDRGATSDTEDEEDEDEEDEEGETSKKPKPKTDDTCLGKANLAFDDPECNECMSDDAACCQATITCFKDDPNCAALHTCMQKCGGGGAADGPTTFANEVFPAVNPPCGSCHLAGTGGAPIFFGPNADATYPLFKARNYHLPNSLFVTKGLHDGPALTPAQRAAVDKWVAAEAAPPPITEPGPDGGVAECKEACKAQYPGSVTAWETYNACTTTTCRAECL